jgi:dynactin 1
MIEELTEKNLTLEEKIQELESQNEELEALRNISEELEESQSAVEKQLRSEIYAKEIEILDQAGNITNLKNKLVDYERTVEQFRNVVRSQQDQLIDLKQKEIDVMSQASEITSQSQALMNITHKLQTKALKTSAIKIDQDLSKLLLNQANLQLSFVKDFIPTNTFQSDFDCLSFSLLLKRFLEKSNLIAKTIQHIRIEFEKSDDQYSVEELTYHLELRHLMNRIRFICNDFDFIFNSCDVDLYLKMGKLYFELSPNEKSLDSIISLLRDEELTPTFNLSEVKELLNKL